MAKVSETRMAELLAKLGGRKKGRSDMKRGDKFNIRGYDIEARCHDIMRDREYLVLCNNSTHYLVCVVWLDRLGVLQPEDPITAKFLESYAYTDRESIATSYQSALEAMTKYAVVDAQEFVDEEA